jgi:phosphoribosylformimino-5-aminoimidazole carboxamide ribotide isomerase
VLLTRVDVGAAKVDEPDPVAQARRFAAAGAEWLHVVDLDGARDGNSRQVDLITGIAAAVPLKLQAGGGVRDASAIERLLDCGVERAIVGSLAAENPQLVRKWLERFGPARIVLAFDVRFNAIGEPEVLTQGWQNRSGQPLWPLLERFAGSGVKTVMCTDVDRDGMLGGSNTALYAALQDRWPSLDVLASGGVRDMADLLELKRSGVAGPMFGKALYMGRFYLTDAIRQAKHVG